MDAVNLQSSLLLSAINQMPVISGNIKVGGSVSYVPQESWVYSGTLRENILFGKYLEKSRYEEVVEICALAEVWCVHDNSTKYISLSQQSNHLFTMSRPITLEVSHFPQDIDRMPSSDQTLVGERGLSLSGGQKARINLARLIQSWYPGLFRLSKLEILLS